MPARAGTVIADPFTFAVEPVESRPPRRAGTARGGPCRGGPW